MASQGRLLIGFAAAELLGLLSFLIAILLYLKAAPRSSSRPAKGRPCRNSTRSAEIYASQLFWLAIFFGTMFAVIGLGMLPKIVGTVDRRDEKIADDLKNAEGAREKADTLEEDYRAEMDSKRAER